MKLKESRQALQNADGTPHFTYYVSEHLLSFVWDGRSNCIEVCHGGYGEPVVEIIPIETPEPSTPAVYLTWFRMVCNRYVKVHWG